MHRTTAKTLVRCWRKQLQNIFIHSKTVECGYSEATYEDISQDVNGQIPQTYFKVVAKWLQDNKAKVSEWPSQSPDLNPVETVGRTEKHVWERRPY